ncbi:3'-5' exonuclease [Anaerotignum sp.]
MVFIIDITEETFPHYRAVNNGGREMGQEKNNIYVAVARAKRFMLFILS